MASNRSDDFSSDSIFVADSSAKAQRNALVRVSRSVFEELH